MSPQYLQRGLRMSLVIFSRRVGWQSGAHTVLQKLFLASCFWLFACAAAAQVTMEREVKPIPDDVVHPKAALQEALYKARRPSIVHIRPDGNDEVFTGLSLKCKEVKVTKTCVSGS